MSSTSTPTSFSPTPPLKRIFVTGGTGFIGPYVIRELIAHSYKVLALARSDAAEAKLRSISDEIEVHRGSLNDIDSLRRGASQCDGVAHLAFEHDFSRYEASAAAEAAATRAIGEALAGTNKPLVVTTGTLLAQSSIAGEPARETDPPSAAFSRGANEDVTRELASTRGVRAMVIRLSPTVHGDGDRGFVPLFHRLAREKGVAAYVGDGRNVWPAVHVTDAARLYRLALEKGRAGHRYHAVGESPGVEIRSTMEVIARRAGVKAVSLAVGEEATNHFGPFFSMALQMNNAVSNELTRTELGWVPSGPTLHRDIDRDEYYAYGDFMSNGHENTGASASKE